MSGSGRKVSAGRRLSHVGRRHVPPYGKAGGAAGCQLRGSVGCDSEPGASPHEGGAIFLYGKTGCGEAVRRQSRKAKGLAVSVQSLPALVFKFKYYTMVYSHVVCSPPLLFWLLKKVMPTTWMAKFHFNGTDSIWFESSLLFKRPLRFVDRKSQTSP